MNLAILPLVLTMLAGSQVMSAIIFVTSKSPIRVSVTFIIGVAIVATAGVLIAIDVGSLLGSNRSHSTYGGVATTQAILLALTGRGNLPQFANVAPTLVIAALFDPLRRRIQYFIDRRFYRRKYDAAKTLETFSLKLRGETDLATLGNGLMGVVRETCSRLTLACDLRVSSILVTVLSTTGRWILLDPILARAAQTNRGGCTCA